jgi:sporulation protein YhbH
MSIFKEHKTTADRSASDRSRHKKKIERAIREGIHDIVADESIIGQDGKKKIKIPVKGIKEYRFVYGDNDTNKQVGSAPGKNIRKGQQIGKADKKETAQGNKPGKEAGEEYYDVEISLEELAAYLFDSLNLPDLEKKRFTNIIGEKMKRHGYRNQGIRPRFDKKETLKKKIKRKSAAIRAGTYNEDEDERFPFHESDLRYKFITETPKENSNAVIFFMMDVSGSMGTQKKFIARSFFFLLYQFLRYKYDNIEVVFIAHTTEAKEVSEEEFFARGQSGGTFISTAPHLALEIMNKRYHPSSWNIYAFHGSDGDNWSEDNEKALAYSKELRDKSQMYGFIEIKPTGDQEYISWSGGNTMMKVYSPLADDKFKTLLLENKDDIWPAFVKLFGGVQNV